MGIKLPRRGIRKRLVVAICLLMAYSLNAMEVEVLPDTLITGRVITLKIKTEILDTEPLDVNNIDFPEGLILISGPLVRPYYARLDGVNRRYHQITWALKSKSSGVYTLPDIDFISNSEMYTLSIPTLRVLNSDEVYNNYPLIVTWKDDIKKEIFVGESLPLVVEAYNLEEINFPSKVVSTNPRRGESIKVSGLGDITPEIVDGANLYRVPMASWIYTSFEPGNITIPSVRVDINGVTRYTDSLNILVKPLPEVNATGGVGEFLISTSLSESQVTPEDTFHYKVRISGQGNIPYIQFPQIDYSGLILIDKNEKEQIDVGEKGYLGWREFDYTLQALEPGVKEISLSEVSWIDINGNETQYNGNITHINVVSVKVVEEDILPFLSFMRTPEIISSYTISLYKIPFMWLLLCFSSVSIFFISIFKIVKTGREKKSLLITVAISTIFLSSSIFARGFEFQGDLVAADNHIDAGEYSEALMIYDELSSKLPNNYGVFVNKSILWDKLDSISNAVYNIRIAERIVPNNRKVSFIKDYLTESEESRQKQAKTANRINPDLIFIIFVIFFNCFILALIKLNKVRNITIFSLLFTTLLFTMLSGIMLFLVDSKNNIDAGIISSGGANLTKVPNNMALEWMTLDEGNCVYIRSEWNDKFLIETEYGLKGWILKDSILVLEER